jgi:hypothetical protein
MQRIREQFPYQLEGTSSNWNARCCRALRRYITDGEWDDIKSAMPKDLAAALP